MKTSVAVAHFKSRQAVADALGLCKQAIHQWGEIVPPRRAYELERITGGALKADTGVEAVSNGSVETEIQNATPVAKQG